ncbi:glycoside hydrolase family 16 protein [Auriculariales sp. MPI-PUGE-AT-0066]|nr:glycoside hydrolase family 16 protein [Auriculariales sp. MPI-PUGE-AT-0066]
MFTFKTFVVLVAALGAATAKPAKRCEPTGSTDPTPTDPSTDPTSTGPPAPPETPPPSGGGSQGEYSQTANIVGEGWYDAWEWWANEDPTHGRVQYVDLDTTRQLNLTSVEGDRFIIRADTSQGSLDPNGPGRRAVRIQTKEAYTKFTSVLDVRHMPAGRGSWPAYWTCGENWPYGGELDIIEGVNNGDRNLMSLHTGPDCRMPDSRDMSGEPANPDCNCENGANGNQGCNTVDVNTASFGPNFNAKEGGWYVVERSDTTIKIWFWNRDDPNVPADVKSNTGAVSPSTWGRPVALFVSDQCDIGSKFGPNKFIINTTFCGDWAGNAFQPGGMGGCIDFVNNNPDEYKDAYWDINRMSIYQ